MAINRGAYRADLVEGYDAFWYGDSRDSCPYPPGDGGPTDTRHWWLTGWDIANREHEKDPDFDGLSTRK